MDNGDDDSHLHDVATQVFEDLDFTLMEMNPFTLDHAGNPFPLDMRGELDDTAAFKSAKKWGGLEFPLPFGRTMTAAEEYVHSLDGNTGKDAPPPLRGGPYLAQRWEGTLNIVLELSLDSPTYL